MQRKEYKARIEIRGKCRFVRLFGQRRGEHVDVMIDWQAPIEQFTGSITTTDPEVQARLDEALRVYSGPKGLWEEERRLR